MCGVERRMITMCRVKLVDKAFTDVLCDKVSVVVMIENMIIQSLLRWYGHVMSGDISSQIRKAIEVKIKMKRKKD